MKIKQLIDKNFIFYIIGLAIIIFLFIFLVTCTQIGYDVQKRCEFAQYRYGGDCVNALMNQISDEDDQYNKNSAIWALGQLGDKQALPFLEKYNNHKELPEYESWQKGISQYELRKAIRLLNSGINLSAFVWRD